MKTLIDIAKEGNGYVTSAQADELGIPRRCLSELAEAGDLIRLDRGLYALPDTWEDPFYITQYRFSRGVFSDETALFLHGMTDRAPFSLTMTFPRSYNATNAKNAGLICRSCADAALDLGLTEIKTSYGNIVRVYDIERTLCDLLRGQGVVDDQVVTPAMQAYVKLPNKNLPKLMDYARLLGVEKKVRTYVRVLL